MPTGQDLLKVALAQINPTVGDIPGNARKIAERISEARDQGAALVVFPELTLSGYPPEDLLLKTSFLEQVAAALQELAAQTRGIVALVGFPESADDVYNAAAVLADGEVAAIYRKMYLPNYGVFDEQRYFQSGAEAGIFELNGVPIGITICEDIWEPGPPAMTEALAGAQVIVNLSASPYRVGYGHGRERMLVQRAVDNLAAVVFVQHGGRPGRAGLRRAQRRPRPGRARAGALPAVRGEPRALHDRPARGRLGAPARHPPPRQRAPPAPRHPGGRAARRPPRRSPGRERREDRRRRGGGPARARGRGLRRPANRTARLRAQERLRARGARHLGRHRLRPRRADRGRRARPRERDLRLDALPLLQRGHAGRRPRDRNQPRGRLPRDPDRRRDGGLLRAARRLVRGHRARHRRGERAGAHPRQRRDGPVQQVRLARARHRQQVRAVGRLRDLVRRHGRRLRRC